MKIRTKDLPDQFVLPLWNEKALEVIDTYVIPSADIQTSLITGIGKEILKKYAEYKFKAFSSYEVTIEEVLHNKAYYVYKWKAQGIHTGSIFNIPPSGQKISISGIACAKLKNGNIISYQSFSDFPRVMLSTDLQLENKNEENKADLIFKLIGKKLTRREIECLSLWLQGYCIKGTAKALGGISSRTIQTFRENIKRKLNVDTYQQLLHLVIEKGALSLFLKNDKK